jgi:acetyl-CoA carboxylase carboxyltransferase component
MTVRERIAALVDPEGFWERGVLSGLASYDEKQENELKDFTPCPFIMGIGKINGRRLAIHGDDFRVSRVLIWWGSNIISDDLGYGRDTTRVMKL